METAKVRPNAECQLYCTVREYIFGSQVFSIFDKGRKMWLSNTFDKLKYECIESNPENMNS